MRNLNFALVVFIIIAFLTTSCQKEEIESIDSSLSETESLLTTTDSDDPNELRIIEDLIPNPKGMVLGQKSFQENKGLIEQAAAEYKRKSVQRQSTSRSRGGRLSVTTPGLSISCGETKYGRSDFYNGSIYDKNTYRGCNDFTSSFNADDVEYSLRVDVESIVEITLDQLRADLDVFIFTNNWGIGDCLDSSIKTNTSSEKITIHLLPGTYWILIDGYNEQQVSDYRLKVNCTPLNNQCDLSDGFENYTNGDQISVTNSYDWTRYEAGAALDGIVTTAKSYSGRKSIQFDWNNAYADDNQPKDLFKLGNRNSGMYAISFKMFVDHNSNAKIALHKFDSPRNTAIEFFFRKANGFVVRSQDNYEYLSGTYSQGRWIDVEFHIDLDNKRGELYVEGRLIHDWDTSTYAYNASASRNTIGGLQFAAYHENSKFYIDDICFEETDVIAITNGG